MLTTHGPQAFAAALVGDVDTPELIWTHRMRGQRLVPQVRDFPERAESEDADALSLANCFGKLAIKDELLGRMISPSGG